MSRLVCAKIKQPLISGQQVLLLLWDLEPFEAESGDDVDDERGEKQRREREILPHGQVLQLRPDQPEADEVAQRWLSGQNGPSGLTDGGKTCQKYQVRYAFI